VDEDDIKELQVQHPVSSSTQHNVDRAALGHRSKHPIFAQLEGALTFELQPGEHFDLYEDAPSELQFAWASRFARINTMSGIKSIRPRDIGIDSTLHTLQQPDNVAAQAQAQA